MNSEREEILFIQPIENISSFADNFKLRKV